MIAAANRQSVVIDGRHVPTYNGTVSNLNGYSATPDTGVLPVTQRVRPNLPFNNPLAQNPPIPPVPSIPQNLEQQPRKSGERQVPAFDSLRPQSQSSFYPSRTTYVQTICSVNTTDEKVDVVNQMLGSHLRAPMAPLTTSRPRMALQRLRTGCTTEMMPRRSRHDGLPWR